MKKIVRFSSCSKQYDGVSSPRQLYINFIMFFNNIYYKNNMDIPYEIESYLKEIDKNILSLFIKYMNQDFLKLKDTNKPILINYKHRLSPDLIYPIERFIIPILNSIIVYKS